MKKPCILLKICGYEFLQIINISCNNIGLYSLCSSGVNEPFNGRGKLNNYADMRNSFFQADVHGWPSHRWHSCSTKQEEERAPESDPSCLGHMPDWIPALCGSSPWTMLSFTKLLPFCGAGTAGADRLSLSCQDVILAWAGPSTPWDKPSTSFGLALPCNWQWWHHQAGQRGRGPWAKWKHPMSPCYFCAHSQHHLFLFQDTDFLANSLWCYVASNQILFLVDPPWCIKSIFKSVDVMLRDMV